MEQKFDVIIVGGGPAGLTAALYLARAKYRVLVLEKEKFGGQITITEEIVNYPGVGKTSGKALTEQMRLQAQAFGAEFAMEKVEHIDMEGDFKKVICDGGKVYEGLGVVLAWVPIPGSWASWEKRNFRAGALPTVPPATASSLQAVRFWWWAAAWLRWRRPCS